MQTNFDLEFGQTLRLVDGRGEVVSELGIVDPNAQYYTIRASDLQFAPYGVGSWFYVPQQSGIVNFIVPSNQGVFGIMDVRDIDMILGGRDELIREPGQTVSMSVEGIVIGFGEEQPHARDVVLQIAN
jgi:hypothetical protein